MLWIDTQLVMKFVKIHVRGAPLDFQGGGSRKFLEKKNHPLEHRFKKKFSLKDDQEKNSTSASPKRKKKKIPTSFHREKKKLTLYGLDVKKKKKKKKIPFTIFKQTKKISNGHHYNY